MKKSVGREGISSTLNASLSVILITDQLIWEVWIVRKDALEFQ
jgi:hypothetical protein